MAFEDLRSLLKTLERQGELRRITAQVDPYLEVGEITDRMPKALLCCSRTSRARTCRSR
jgi:4-hydroxy-3-polyprenylbenzoate decarboxylase